MKKLLTLISAVCMLCGSLCVNNGAENVKKTVTNPCPSSVCETADNTSKSNENCDNNFCLPQRQEQTETAPQEKAETAPSKETAASDTASAPAPTQKPSSGNTAPASNNSTPSCANSSSPACNNSSSGNNSKSGCRQNTPSSISEIINKALENIGGGKAQTGGNTASSAPAETQSQVTVATDSEAQAVFEIVNRERLSNGLSALEYRSDVQAAADKRAAEIVTSFSHTRPNGSSCFTALSETGVSYRAAGENIAYGQRTPEEVMNGWMNSSGHRANILNSNFTGIAVGVVTRGNTKYWVQIFVK